MALFAKDASTYADYTVTLTKNLNLEAHSWLPIVGTSFSNHGGIVGTSTGSVSKCLYYGTRLHKDMNHQPRLLAGSNGGEMNYIPRYDDDLNHLA